MKAKIRALTHRTSQQDLEYVLTRLNMIMHGWANYFRHAVAKQHLRHAGQLHLVAGDPHAEGTAPLEMEGRPPPVHHPTGRWLPITAGEIELRRIAAIPVTRYRYRGSKIPSPWTLPEHA